MIRLLFSVSLCLTLLTACTAEVLPASSSGSLLQGVSTTVGDAVFSAKQYVGTVVNSVMFVKSDVGDRIEKVGTGLEKIKEGKEMIDAGLGR